MCGTRKIPHSCHRKKVWRFFLSCTASQISVEHSNLVFSILHVSSMHSHFRFAAFISLRVYFSDVCRDTAIWFTTFDPITPIGFFYVRGVRHFVVAFLFLCLVVVSLSLRCLSPLPSWRAWRSTRSRNDKRLRTTCSWMNFILSSNLNRQLRFEVQAFQILATCTKLLHVYVSCFALMQAHMSSNIYFQNDLFRNLTVSACSLCYYTSCMCSIHVQVSYNFLQNFFVPPLLSYLPPCLDLMWGPSMCQGKSCDSHHSTFLCLDHRIWTCQVWSG